MYKVIGVNLNEFGTEVETVLFYANSEQQAEEWLEHHEQDLADSCFYAIYIDE